jgi:hypothetical protein
MEWCIDWNKPCVKTYGCRTACVRGPKKDSEKISQLARKAEEKLSKGDLLGFLELSQEVDLSINSSVIKNSKG